MSTLIVLAACGGAASDRLTHAALVTKASGICRAAGQPYAGPRPTEPAAFLSFLQAQVPAEEKGLRALEALRPASPDQAEWTDQILAPERAQLADAKVAATSLRSALAAHDQSAALLVVRRTTNQLDERGLGINAYWRANGMTACLDSPL